jgi:hypothetical protein
LAAPKSVRFSDGDGVQILAVAGYRLAAAANPAGQSVFAVAEMGANGLVYRWYAPLWLLAALVGAAVVDCAATVARRAKRYKIVAGNRLRRLSPMAKGWGNGWAVWR